MPILAQIVFNKKQTNNIPLDYILGFSLLEILIAMLIVSIISMFSFPIYKDYLIKSNRIEAKSALYDLANRLENHFNQHNTYANATIGIGQVTDVLSSNLTTNNRYILNIISASQHSYTIQATLTNYLLDKECISFILNNTGKHDAIGNKKQNCW